MVSRDADGTGEMLQVAVGDAICAMGGEVLLIDAVTNPAAALLTQKYRADFTVSAAGGYIEIFDSTGRNISRADEQKIERIMDGVIHRGEEFRTGDGEIYCRRDAWLDYVNALWEAAGARKTNTKILIDCPAGNMKKAAQFLFSRLTKNIIWGEGSSITEEMKKSGADIGFRFDGGGRVLTVADACGGIVSAEDIYCLSAAKMAEKNIFGSTIKEKTGKGIRLSLTENGSVHFADVLPGPDALFTALMLSSYISDKDEPLHELVKGLVTENTNPHI